MPIAFPEGFLWGTATAAHQVEGGNWNNDWWAWEHEPARVDETFSALFELHRQRKIDPVIYRAYPLAELPAALEALGSRQSYGKVVVTP